MTTTRRAALAAAFLVGALQSGPAPAQQAPSYSIPYDEDDRATSDEVREAFRRGYDRGYRKGVEDGKRMVVAAPPPPPPPVPTGPIRVTSAFYGNDSRRCDATRQVARQVNGRASASFEVSNSICGDPSPGNRKELEVVYTCGAVAKSASAYEHRTVYLGCP